MRSLLPHSTSSYTPTRPILFSAPNSRRRSIHFRRRPANLRPHSSVARNNDLFSSASNQDPWNQSPRTPFPGGHKRPEIKVPDLVLQLSCEEVLEDPTALGVVDDAVSKCVGVVVLSDGVGGGGRLYEAACRLKSVIRDRAYLVIAERVDIAAAVNASGVVLSDQGLPAIVARNTMIDSKSDSVVLPLVARNVQDFDAALNASNSEGADFLLYWVDGEGQIEELVSSVSKSVKVPIFFMIQVDGFDALLGKAEKLLESGASGLVFSLEELKLFSVEVLSKLVRDVDPSSTREQETLQNDEKPEVLDIENGFPGKTGAAGFITLKDRECQMIETEKLLMLEVIKVIREAAPLMEDVSLLVNAVSQLDQPFMLVIVGEFNSGKSTVINALLGNRYLKDGVIPTTNEITFLRYSELKSNEQQHCERHPDGQYICYLPAPILKDMIIVDTPGTNVILQRQQRLTEEFVPRADLLLFVISADRPLTESEVSFLRYTQQWKKKVVFVLNKSDLYQNANELEEAIAFVKENTQKLLNSERVTIYPIAARPALEEKLSAASHAVPHWRTSSFHEFEEFLYSFLDGSTSTGIERMKLKLETPITIGDQLLSACQKLVKEKCQQAQRDLMSVNKLVDSVKEYRTKMESASISWKRQTSSLMASTQARIIKVVESTLQLSNLDVAVSHAFKEKSAPMPATSSIQNDIIIPALSDAHKLLEEYVAWLQSSNAHEGRQYKESFERQWPSVVDTRTQAQLETELLRRKCEQSLKMIETFSAVAASKLFEQEIREIFLETFGGLGAAGLSASLLTSVLPTTLEDLLALGLCSAGGLLAISNFPARRQKMVDKVKKAVDAFARELEEMMEKDLLEAIESLENFVELFGQPYQDLSQHRLDENLETQQKLSNVEKKLETLWIEIQNLHVS